MPDVRLWKYIQKKYKKFKRRNIIENNQPRTNEHFGGIIQRGSSFTFSPERHFEQLRNVEERYSRWGHPQILREEVQPVRVRERAPIQGDCRRRSMFERNELSRGVAEVSLDDLETELADLLGDDIGMPSTHYTIASDHTSTNEYIDWGNVGIPLDSYKCQCHACNKKYTNVKYTRLCPSCRKDYNYMIKILKEYRGKWSTLLYIKDYARYLNKHIGWKKVISLDSPKKCSTCSKVYRTNTRYITNKKFDNIYICKMCESHLQYFMKSMYSSKTITKMGRMVNMIRDCDIPRDIRKKYIPKK